MSLFHSILNVTGSTQPEAGSHPSGNTERKASGIKKESFLFPSPTTSQREIADLKFCVTLLYGRKPSLD